MSRFVIPFFFGLIGCAVLVSLGIWQVQRLAWKEGVLADIEARISAAPVSLPDAPNADEHRYLPVTAEGYLGPRYLRVLVSRKKVGAGYRLITGFNIPGSDPMLIDLGFLKVSDDLPVLPAGPVVVEGNLHWPDDRNSSTPENDMAGNIWFARDLEPMSEALQVRPLLLVARDVSHFSPQVTPLPVDTSAIPNDHLSYAITWFSLAAIWAVMTSYFMWRMRHPLREA